MPTQHNLINVRLFAFDTMQKPLPYCTPAMAEMLSMIVHGTPPTLDTHGKRVLHEMLVSRGWIDRHGRPTAEGRARVKSWSSEMQNWLKNSSTIYSKRNLL